MQREPITFRMWETRSVTGYGWDVYFYKSDENNKMFRGVPKFEWVEAKDGHYIEREHCLYVPEQQIRELGKAVMMYSNAFGIKPTEGELKLLGKIEAYEKQIDYLQNLVSEQWQRIRVLKDIP